jgi:hypothetical protein
MFSTTLRAALLPPDLTQTVRHIARKAKRSESEALITALLLMKDVVDGEVRVVPAANGHAQPANGRTAG